MYIYICIYIYIYIYIYVHTHTHTPSPLVRFIVESKPPAPRPQCGKQLWCVASGRRAIYYAILYDTIRHYTVLGDVHKANLACATIKGRVIAIYATFDGLSIGVSRDPWLLQLFVFV